MKDQWLQMSIKDIVAYTVDDIKSVFQDSDALNAEFII